MTRITRKEEGPKAPAGYDAHPSGESALLRKPLFIRGIRVIRSSYSRLQGNAALMERVV
jgi:hypothetical protein